MMPDLSFIEWFSYTLAVVSVAVVGISFIERWDQIHDFWKHIWKRMDHQAD